MQSLVPIARRLRREMTPREVLLWVHLKALNRQGWRFRRQAPIGRYVADFASFRARLVIELDGGGHTLPDRRARDAERDAVLAGQGFTVLRFWNHEVDDNLPGVMDAIVHALGGGAPPGARRRPGNRSS